MSKELAQTVGGKRVAWLLALLAAFAVVAAVGARWQSASATLPTTSVGISSVGGTLPGQNRIYTATFTFTPSPSPSAGGGSFVLDLDDDLINVTVTASGIPGIPASGCSVGAGNVVTCPTVANANGFTSGTITVQATNPYGGGTIDPPSQCQVTEGPTVACSGSAHSPYFVANAVPVTPTSATNARGVPETFTFAFSGTETCASDVNDNSITPECTAADVNLSPGLTLQSITVVGSDVLVTVINSSPTSTGGTVSLDVATGDDPDATGYTTFTSAVGTKTYVQPYIQHLADDGSVITGQEVNNNVRGSQHTICVTDGNGLGLTLPGITLSNIVVTNGGGYASTADTDPTFTDVIISTQTVGGQPATCITWRSLDAGDQTISIVYVGADGQQYNVLWRPATGPATQGLVKEWNRLEDSVVTLSGGASGTGTGNSTTTPVITRTLGLVLNPLNGQYQGATVTISDTFRGSHTNSAGQKEGPMPLAGVVWEVDRAPGSSSCGTLGGTLSGVTTLTSTPAPSGSPNTHNVGGTPSVTFDPTGCNPGQVVTIRIRGSEPGALGSGTPTTVTQLVQFEFAAQIPAKHVFLAWAGQRVVLEHNWALNPNSLGSTEESCLVNPTTAQVRYVKSSGPGTFLPGGTVTGTTLVSPGVLQADASVTSEGTFLGRPYPVCTSVAVYESEDQGQVDIEAFIQDAPASKVAWVIYYMKIERVKLSLVTQVSKPLHNSSSLPDWAPGNPWDASQDKASPVDSPESWNVSKDVLVRGRVQGWFKNSNPSGRPADTSNPLNVLPADRWVMPDDWAVLAGGPGVAEQFRPYYDIMIAPNNTASPKRTLLSPDGVAAVPAQLVAVGNTGVGSATSPISVSSCTGITAPGTLIVIGSTPAVVQSCTGTSLVLVTALSTPPAGGTVIAVVSGVPFIGPYSALDIRGLSPTFGTTAPTSYPGYTVRDTAWGDGQVNWWDAPMPPAPVSIALRGTGFIKQVIKSDVYYEGTPNTLPVALGGTQTYPNPYYWTEIPESPFIPAVAAGGGYMWDSWGTNGSAMGPYQFWKPVRIGVNSAGIGEIPALSADDQAELAVIRTVYGDPTIARDLVVYSDNHGEFMVAANGDFKTDLAGCATNALAGGKHCKPGDNVGVARISAVADYPDFRGKHPPVASNVLAVQWTWGGYKDVSIQDGETDQFKYIVFHALDRDGFCRIPAGAVSLHPVLSGVPTDSWTAGNRVYPPETVDFLIDSGDGIIVGSSLGGTINDGKRFATGVKTYSIADTSYTGKKFPVSPRYGQAGQTDECQAWIRVSNSLLGILNVLVVAHNDEGDVGFDTVVDLSSTTSYTLNFRWSLITWAGANDIPVMDAIKGTGSSGKNPGGNDISASVTAIYGWNAAAQQWLGFFPAGVNVPGANDLTVLKTGEAYWIAITGPSSVTWTIATNIN